MNQLKAFDFSEALNFSLTKVTAEICAYLVMASSNFQSKISQHNDSNGNLGNHITIIGGLVGGFSGGLIYVKTDSRTRTNCCTLYLDTKYGI